MERPGPYPGLAWLHHVRQGDRGRHQFLSTAVELDWDAAATLDDDLSSTLVGLHGVDRGDLSSQELLLKTQNLI